MLRIANRNASARISRLFLILGSFGLAGPAVADCRPMELTSDPGSREAKHIDFDNDGRSHGDKHIGGRDLFDEAGAKVGTARWISISHDETIAIATTVFSLDDGVIYTTAMYDSGGTPNVEAVGFQSPIVGAITGGTGAYLHASGSMELHRDGEDVVYKLDMKCE